MERCRRTFTRTLIMKKIKTIIDSYFALLAYKLDLFPQAVIKVVEQRKEACSDCLLREGNWCSSKKEIKLNFKNRTPKSIKGCGCFLPAKQFSILNEDNKCPLNLWDNFD